MKSDKMSRDNLCLAACLFSLLLWKTTDAFGNLFSSQSVYSTLEGDVMLGGLVAIHDAGGVNSADSCRSNMSELGIQRVEAMRYSIHKINSDPDLLKGVRLGMEIRDSCGSETHALDEALQFVIDKVNVCRQSDYKSRVLFGVVGPSMSLLTAAVASLLRLFSIPLVSYAATSTELTDKSKYNFLLRTVPPDLFQALAMAEFISHELKWKSVFALYSSGSYGEHGFQAFERAATNHSLCVVTHRKIPPNASVEDLSEFLREFFDAEKNVTGIVCYCEMPDARNIVQAIRNLQLENHFHIIGSDTWFQIRSIDAIVFSLHYNQSRLIDFYDNWYSKLNLTNVPPEENPWFRRFWETACEKSKFKRVMEPREGNDKFPKVIENNKDCENDGLENCEKNNDNNCDSLKLESYEQDDKIAYVIDSIFAFAHAIDNLIYSPDGNYKGDINKFKKDPAVGGLDFIDNFLRKVDFSGTSGRVQFPAKGNYDIAFVSRNNSKQLNLIGQWRQGVMNVNEMGRELLEGFKKSNCQTKCGPAERRSYTTSKCCWRCKPCKWNEYKANIDSCRACSHDTRPNANLTGCVRLPLKHVDRIWFILVSLFCVLGCLLTFITTIIFLRNNHTPLVKASGREMTYFLLLGIICLYILPFFLLSHPTAFTCGVSKFGTGFFMCLCYSALLIKTNRIARIFSGRQDLLFLSPQWQVVLCMLLLTPQTCISIVGLYQVEGFQETKFYSRYGVVSCRAETLDFYATFAYNLLIIFVTTYYAFKTRKVPANFNEARYIGFVMYTTIVIWLAFLPVFFGTSDEYKTIALILDLIIIASTLLVGLFGVKMYVILLRPDKNSHTNSKIRTVTFFSDKSDNGQVVIKDAPLKQKKNERTDGACASVTFESPKVANKH